MTTSRVVASATTLRVVDTAITPRAAKVVLAYASYLNVQVPLLTSYRAATTAALAATKEARAAATAYVELLSLAGSSYILTSLRVAMTLPWVALAARVVATEYVELFEKSCLPHLKCIRVATTAA